jgi:transposase-like protein
MKGKRKKYSAEFKAKVAMEAVKERETLAELSARYEVSQVVIARWKKEITERSSEIFKTKPDNEENREKEKKELYAKIGKLEMKLDFAKRASKELGVPMPEDD